jgi:hypothetical protein
MESAGQLKELPDSDDLLIKAMSVPLTNQSGGSLAEGDVVVVDAANSNAVTTTTSLDDTKVAGVVVVGGADKATVYVAVAGFVDTVTVDAQVVNISPGDLLYTGTTAKRAVKPQDPVTNGALLGKALGSATTNGAQIAALITLA